MKVDFNNLRKQTAYSLDRVIKTLNAGILPENEFASYEKNGKTINVQGDVLVDKDDLQDNIDQLRQQVWALLCCYEEGSEDNKDCSEEVEKSGGIARFNRDGE